MINSKLVWHALHRSTEVVEGWVVHQVVARRSINVSVSKTVFLFICQLLILISRITENRSVYRNLRRFLRHILRIILGTDKT